MSTPANSAIASSTSRSSSMNHKQLQHLHDGPDELKEQQEQCVKSEVIEAQPPSARLYRHALESIFAFLSLKELNAVLTVSHLWSSAVVSMRSIDATLFNLPRPAVKMCLSRLAHHIGCLSSREDTSGPLLVTCDELYVLSLRMRNLHTLHFTLTTLIDACSLHFPPSLTRLYSKLPEGALDAEINSLIRVISRIPNIQQVVLNLLRARPGVTFAPFLACPYLCELGLHHGDGKPFSSTQVDEIRAMPHLIRCMGSFRAIALRPLLRTPHQLKPNSCL